MLGSLSCSFWAFNASIPLRVLNSWLFRSNNLIFYKFIFSSINPVS
jgi:hypothetical protein